MPNNVFPSNITRVGYLEASRAATREVGYENFGQRQASRQASRSKQLQKHFSLFWSLAALIQVRTDDFMNKSNIEYYWVDATYGTTT